MVESYYIIVLYERDPRLQERVLRVLERNGRVQAVAILANLHDPRVLGGLKSISKEIVFLRGYLPLPK